MTTSKPPELPAGPMPDYAAMQAEMVALRREVQLLANANALTNLLENGIELLSTKLEPLGDMSPKREPLPEPAAEMLRAIRKALDRPTFAQSRLALIRPSTPTNSIGSTAS